MRFLVLTQYYLPEIGAPQVRLTAVIRELIKLGHEVEVVTAMPNHPNGRIFPEYRGEFYRREEWEGVPLHRVWLYASTGAGVKRIVNYLSFTFTSLWGLFQAKRPDYIFVESPPLFLSMPAYLASLIWRRPIIFNVADIWPDAARELGLIQNETILKTAERLEHWSYRRAKYVNTVTDIFLDTLKTKKNLPLNKLLFLPNGIDTELFQPKPPDYGLLNNLGLTGKKIFLYAGTHGYAHNMEIALEAAKLVEAQDASIALLFVGDGSEKAKLVAMAKAMDLKNVTFLDPVPPAQVARLYSISVAGLSTLRGSYNTRPVKIFASMSCARPVVYSGKGEGATIIDAAKAGVIIPPEDAEGLAKAMVDLANNDGLASRLGKNGRRYVKEKMQWSALVENWLEQLDKKELDKKGLDEIVER